MNDPQILEQLSLTDAYAPEMDMPESAWSHDVAFAEVERRIGGRTRTTTAPMQPTPTRQRGWLIAAVAFAVVIFVIGAAMLLARPADNMPPVTTPSTTQPPPPTTTEALPPTTVATDEAVEEVTVTTIAPIVEAEAVMTDEVVALLDSYQTAFNAGDEATFNSFFAEDFWRADPTSLDWWQPVEYMLHMMTNSHIQGTTLSIENCTPTAEGARCEFVYDGAVEQGIYYGPIRDTVTVFIDGGEVTHMLITEWETGDLQERSGQKVLDWVEENFPDDRPKMSIVAIGVVNDQLGLDPIEVVELWAKYVPLWTEAGRP
jgi:hypothetical protein